MTHPEMSLFDWGNSPIDSYIKFIFNAGGKFTFQGYNVIVGEFPCSVNACDAYLITGSTMSANDEAYEVRWLRHFLAQCYRSRKKLVGICFGHQILAEALGGHSEKTAIKNVGPKRFTINTKKSWMPNNTPTECTLYFIHQDQVLRPPPEAEILASNIVCSNIMYSIGDRVLGIQAHPEITQGMMLDFLGKTEGVDPDIISSTQKNSVDSDIAAQWIVNFLLDS